MKQEREKVKDIGHLTYLQVLILREVRTRDVKMMPGMTLLKVLVVLEEMGVGRCESAIFQLLGRMVEEGLLKKERTVLEDGGSVVRYSMGEAGGKLENRLRFAEERWQVGVDVSVEPPKRARMAYSTFDAVMARSVPMPPKQSSPLPVETDGEER